MHPNSVTQVEPDYCAYATSSLAVQRNVPSWGLARLSSLGPVTQDKMDYWYDAEAAGQGVVVYVLDTGLFTLHDDFERRASFRANFVDGAADDDHVGHGTHIAAIIGGKTYGVAKQVQIIGVKVLGDNNMGKISEIIKGLEWVVTHARNNFAPGKCVVNMSLVTETSEALNRCVCEVVTQAGITVVVGAGNEMVLATGSPASEKSAITVAATTDEDEMWGLSNRGDNVNILAPGGLITSAWIPGKGKSNTNGKRTMSGTSMATAHVSGLAACLISSKTFEGGPEEVRKRILDMALHIPGLRLGLANNGLGGSHVLPID